MAQLEGQLAAERQAAQAQLAEERQAARGAERRLQAHIAALLDERAPSGGEEAAGAFALPPVAHPFWRQPEAPAVAIRMLADADAARAQAAAQLQAALAQRRAQAAQLRALEEKHRALQSTAASLELAAGASRARGV